MTKIMKFEMEQKFDGVDDLYKYILKNVVFFGDMLDIEIQKPLKRKTFCVVGEEKITKRNILFYASKQDFPESLGELIVFAGAYDADIVIFFSQNGGKNYLMPMNWLKKICAKDYELFLFIAKF